MSRANYFAPKYSHSLSEGNVSWQSPSNIALIKYWGKHGDQLPKNSSLSFTLTNCYTKTTLHYEPKVSNIVEFEVYKDGIREESFEPKINQFFTRIEPFLPFLKDYKFRIETTNNFPHSSGIASSASGMSALALCLMDMERQMTEEMSETFFYEKASFLARLGSGSACRSIEGPIIVWGEHENVPRSNDLTGVLYPQKEIHPVFHQYRDTILLVDKGEKQVSSTVGHELMYNHPFADQRFVQATDNLSKLIPVLKNGDLDSFIEIVESEALSLHAMMLTSMPYFILMKPNTLEIINRIWHYRKNSGSKACFTLDAGANVHLLYPESEKDSVAAFIKSELATFCKNGEYINDQVGLGAVRL